MNIAIWIVQVSLAVMFAMAGITKVIQPIATLEAQMPWAGMVPVWMVRAPGLAEILGSLGLLLPSILRIQPKLTVYAAEGLVLVMILAGITHAYLGQLQMIPINVVLGLLAAFVAWGRAKKVPIAAK